MLIPFSWNESNCTVYSFHHCSSLFIMIHSLYIHVLWKVEVWKLICCEDVVCSFWLGPAGSAWSEVLIFQRNWHLADAVLVPQKNHFLEIWITLDFFGVILYCLSVWCKVISAKFRNHIWKPFNVSSSAGDTFDPTCQQNHRDSRGIRRVFMDVATLRTLQSHKNKSSSEHYPP